MKVSFIDLKKQYLSLKPEIDKVISRIIYKSSFVLGKEVEFFEKKFANYCGVKFCLGVNSGTSALHLALLACGIKKGNEVITSPNTFFATAEAISYTGAKPVFVDINPETYTIDINKIEKAITSKTKCILPVHLYGNTAEMEKINKIAKKHNLIIIEDACQAHGVSYKKKKIGTWGKVGCFSFYPGKTLGAYGEGGAVITNDKNIYQRIKILRDHGQLKKDDHRLIGYNYRMEGLQGAVLQVKLKKLNQWILKRREKARLYNSLLKRTRIIVPSEESLKSSNFQYYVIRTKNRDKLRNYLLRNGVSVLIHYPVPIHLQKAYKFLGYKKGDFPVTEKYAKEILSLPMYPELSEKQIYFIVDLIKKFNNNKYLKI